MTYSADEIIKDIKEFENLTVTLEYEDKTPRFKELYSKCFDLPLGDNVTVNDFNKRFQAYQNANAIWR